MDSQEYRKINCPLCGGSIEFPAGIAGQTFSCPRCRQPLTVLEAGQNQPNVEEDIAEMVPMLRATAKVPGCNVAGDEEVHYVKRLAQKEQRLRELAPTHPRHFSLQIQVAMAVVIAMSFFLQGCRLSEIRVNGFRPNDDVVQLSVISKLSLWVIYFLAGMIAAFNIGLLIGSIAAFFRSLINVLHYRTAWFAAFTFALVAFLSVNLLSATFIWVGTMGDATGYYGQVISFVCTAFPGILMCIHGFLFVWLPSKSLIPAKSYRTYAVVYSSLFFYVAVFIVTAQVFSYLTVYFSPSEILMCICLLPIVDIYVPFVMAFKDGWWWTPAIEIAGLIIGAGLWKVGTNSSGSEEGKILDASAQYNLGVCYYNGEGVEKDYAEAVKWFRKSAEQGHAVAQYCLGVSYDKGEGVPQDYAEAVKWFRKSAEQGHAVAQYCLGVFYYRGEGVEKDYVNAAIWFRKAAEQNDAEAQRNLGVCYYNGEGVEKDYAEAVKWFRKSADQGHADAQCYLGAGYAKGEGVEKDYAEAVKWYRKAAESGNMSAQYLLGNCYANGNGVEEDYAEAVKWFHKSADQGNADAQLYLGWCYAKGKGVETNAVEANKWYHLASAQGNESAKKNLAVREQKMTPEQIAEGQKLAREFKPHKTTDSGNSI
jgi:TPR repeat protein